jgi:hypothetical protein
MPHNFNAMYHSSSWSGRHWSAASQRQEVEVKVNYSLRLVLVSSVDSSTYMCNSSESGGTFSGAKSSCLVISGGPRHDVIYSVTCMFHSLGIAPVCIPINCFQMGLETGPMPSTPVGINTSSPRYPILSTGLMTAAVPKKNPTVSA